MQHYSCYCLVICEVKLVSIILPTGPFRGCAQSHCRPACTAPMRHLFTAGLPVKGLDIAGGNSGRKQAQASADDVAKAYEVLLGHGFKDMQIQQAMQVIFFLPSHSHDDIL